VRRNLTLATAAVATAIFEKLSASGDSADNLTLAVSGISGSAELGTYTIRRISGHDDTAALELSVQDYQAADSTPTVNMRPPTLTPSWGSADTLWMWVGAFDNGTRTLSSYPTNYSANQNFNAGAASSAAVGIATATRELAASSETIGNGVLSAAEQWISYAIAIKPAGGGGPVDATAAGITLTAVASLISGSASGGGSSDAAGVTLTAAASLIAGTATGSASNDIRLPFGVDWEQGAEFASQPVHHWSVWSADGTTLHHFGTSGSFNSSGQFLLDINSAAFTVGTKVKLFGETNSGETEELDRTVRYWGGYIVATAQA
jgi:hypothetical protein